MKLGLRRLTLLACLFGVLSGINFARNPSLFLEPALAVDDARHFRDHYNKRDSVVSLTHVSLGYLIVVPQLVAHTLVRQLDVRWVPRAFSVSSLALLTLAFMLFALPGFESLFPRPEIRFGVPVLLALLPAGAFALISTVGFQNWTCLLIAVTLTLLPRPHSIWGAALVFTGMALFAWSNPASLSLGPPLLWMAWRARSRDKPSDARYYATLGVIVIAYLPLGIAPDAWSNLTHASGAETTGAIAWRTGAGFLEAIAYSLDRVVVESLIGYPARVALAQVPGATIALGLLCVTIVAREGWRGHADRPARSRALALLAYAIVAISFANLMARPEWPELLRSERAFRYCTVQKLLWLVLVVCAFEPRLTRLLTSGQHRRFRVIASGVVIYLLWLGHQNAQLYRTELVSPNLEAQIGRSSEDLHVEAQRLGAFLEQVRNTEKTLRPGEERVMTLPRQRYPIAIVVRPR
ncbi:hypothetical protein MK489_24205 [Myxococcota bacterium]|nr:hypothetical protein [Myxococcota bacterium]